jgi:hypothetical protein
MTLKPDEISVGISPAEIARLVEGRLMSGRRRRRFRPGSCSECTPAFSLDFMSGVRGCSSGTTSSRGRHFSLAWLLRGDRLSSELHAAMEGVKLLSHVQSRLERT